MPTRSSMPDRCLDDETLAAYVDGGLAAVERECDALRAEIEHFKANQRQLEEAQARVRDRLAWALDSLHSILDSKM